MGEEHDRPEDPMPGLRRRLRSVGVAGLLVGLVYAMTVISDPPVEGIHAIHPWAALVLVLYALTAAPRMPDAPFGTPGGHLLRALLWLTLTISAGWNAVLHGPHDTLLLVVGPLAALVALVNAGIRVRLAQARP